MSEEIRIYVACLAAYNSGYLHGVWIDVTADIDDIQDQINSMLESSPVDDAEECAIHDFEGYGSYRLLEYEGIESAHEVACFIEEYGEIAAELIAKFIYFGITNRNSLCFGRGLAARTFGAQRPPAINAHASRIMSSDIAKAEPQK